jgi:hypothetical protein
MFIFIDVHAIFLSHFGSPRLQKISGSAFVCTRVGRRSCTVFNHDEHINTLDDTYGICALLANMVFVGTCSSLDQTHVVQLSGVW